MPLDTRSHAIPRLKGDTQLAALGKPERVWVVGSLYGRYGALCQFHDLLTHRIRPKDRIIYLGNYLGQHSLWTGEGPALLDELISFRNSVISIPGFFAGDVTFLRGQGEDMLIEALRLPFQKNPREWLLHADKAGLECYTGLYGSDAGHDVLTDGGVIAMNKWTHQLRKNISHHAGHAEFFNDLKTAAYTQFGTEQRDVAFVPAGLHPHYSLNLQHDLLCWPEEDIQSLTAYQPFARIVRGQSIAKVDPELNRFVLTLDDGKGMDGSLYAACLNTNGHILEWFEF